MLQMLYQRLSQHLQNDVAKEALDALIPEATIDCVQLVCPGRDWQMASKDGNFFKDLIKWRWEQGWRDAEQAVKEAGLRLRGDETASSCMASPAIRRLMPDLTKCYSPNIFIAPMVLLGAYTEASIDDSIQRVLNEPSERQGAADETIPSAVGVCRDGYHCCRLCHGQRH